MSGALAVFVAWTRTFLEEAAGSEEMLPDMNPMILAGFGGCTVSRFICSTSMQDRVRMHLPTECILDPCRTASACAYQLKKRSMLASDMLEHLGTSVELLFDVASGGPGPDAGGGR